jgi:hypothetical protein
MASSTCDCRRLVLPAALVALILAPQAAAAPGPNATAAGAKSAAQAKLAEGVGLLKSQHYDEALVRFQEAYALVPSPLIAYDFGLAHLGRGDDARALESFEAFLDKGLDAPADKRRKAEGYRDELRRRVAVVDLGADVEAADLAVDGLSLGRVSFPRRLYLKPGAHEVTARGNLDSTRQQLTFACSTGHTVSLAIHLSAPPPAPTPAVTATMPGIPALPPAAARASADELRPPSLIQTTAAPEAPPSASPARVWALSIGAAGVATLGAGLAFGLLANNHGDAVTSDSANGRDFVPSTEAAGLHDQRLEEVFVSIGAVAIVAAVGLYALARHREHGGTAPARGAP